MASDLLSFAVNLPDLTMMAAVGWFLWSRYQALENRLDSIERDAINIRNDIHLARKSRESEKEMLEYRINGNHSLIQHKANRLENAILRVSEALEQSSGGSWKAAGTMQYSPDAPTGQM